MKRNTILQYLSYLFLFVLSVFLSYAKTSAWVVSTLEMTKLRRAFNASQTFFKYFPDILKWFLSLKKNGVKFFSLTYILPMPFLYFWGEEYGLKLFYSVFGGLNAVFIYFFINQFFDPKTTKARVSAFSSALMLILSFGFSALSGLCLMDPVMVFFLFLSFYFFIKDKYFWFGIMFTLSALAKGPVLASAPGFALYILIFKRKILKNKHLWISTFLGAVVYFGIKNLMQSSDLQSIQPSLSTYSVSTLNKFHFNHLKDVFISMPVLTIAGILGLFNLTNKSKKMISVIIFSLLSLMVFYFSARTNGEHYIYFMFPFLALLSFFFFKKISLKNIFILFIINLIIFVFSWRIEPIFSRFHKKNLSEMKEIVEANLQEDEFILTHGGVWDYHLWHQPYAVIKDFEWYGSADIRKTKVPKGYVENTGVIIIPKSMVNQLAEWKYFDQFYFTKQIEDQFIFIRER